MKRNPFNSATCFSMHMTIRQSGSFGNKIKMKRFVFGFECAWCAQTIKIKSLTLQFMNTFCTISVARSLLFYWDSLPSNMNAHTGKAIDITKLMAIWLIVITHAYTHICKHTNTQTSAHTHIHIG